MCTAIAFNKSGLFFGRTLDAEGGFGERIVTAPRLSPLHFSSGEVISEHYALLGMGLLHESFPLLFDGFNERGLCGAALNFEGFARYENAIGRKNEIASYELLCRILALCKSVSEAKNLLSGRVITDKKAGEGIEPTPLHWIFADREAVITVEQTESGLSVYENLAGVLANSPDFPFHEKRLSEISHLSDKNPEGEFFSLGYGGLGLPGDYSSPSRFIKASFIRRYAECENAFDFFRVIETVAIPRGAVVNDRGEAHHTVYTSCIEADSLTYLYHAYPSRSIITARLVDPSVTSTTVTYL